MNKSGRAGGRGSEPPPVGTPACRVGLEVGRQVVAACKAAAALVAPVRTGARVLAVVPGQFIRPRKLPCTLLPSARKGSLPRVRPHVRFEVRTLGVPLVTTSKGARKGPTFPAFAPLPLLFDNLARHLLLESRAAIGVRGSPCVVRGHARPFRHVRRAVCHRHDFIHTNSTEHPIQPEGRGWVDWLGSVRRPFELLPRDDRRRHSADRRWRRGLYRGPHEGVVLKRSEVALAIRPPRHNQR
mmetsp:Transcript_4528/g.11595  ORF Transcript_4528/g.11595 Transcript_4528/m.11595 type:complete len:241 (-) Transcript_4528:539-1261(-)